MMDYFYSNKSENETTVNTLTPPTTQKTRNNKGQINQSTLNRILYIGELPPNIDQYELYQLIQSKGKFEIESLTVKTTKDNKSYAYVKFRNRSDAEIAKKLLHLENVRHYIIRVQNFDVHSKDHILQSETMTECNLFVKNLDENTTSEDFYNLFSPFGEINSIKLKTNSLGKCIGYGYVEFCDSNDALTALDCLQDVKLVGRNIKIENFHNIKQRYVENNFSVLFIKQIPPCFKTEYELENFFHKFGKILFTQIIPQNILLPQNNSINNFNNMNNQILSGVIVFETKESAMQAINILNHKYIDNSNIYLELSIEINKEIIDKIWKAKVNNYKTKYENCNLIVKNLPKEIGNKELFEMFKKCGEISSAKIAEKGVFKEKIENGVVMDKEFLYESKGYGYVCFKKPSDARSAIDEMNGKVFSNKGQEYKIVVEYFNYDRIINNGNNSQRTMINNKTAHQGQYKRNINNQKRQKNPMYSDQNTNPNIEFNVSLPQKKFDFRNENIIQDDKFKHFNNFQQELSKILMLKESQERTELLGDKIFYFILKLFQNSQNLILPRDTLNSSTTIQEICSKLTGMFINAQPNVILEIFESEHSLINTINEIINSN
jgi:RNA recognition motif-containing protein